MKQYKDEYEKVFTKQKTFKQKCDIEKISTYNSIPENNLMYINMFKSEMREMEVEMFNRFVKIAWLMRRFCYAGKRRKATGSNGQYMDAAYGLFVRNFVGYDTKFIYSNRTSLVKIISYMDDIFTNFDEGNPFEEEYKFPYKHVTFGHMILVYQMDDKMDLLKYAEKKNISYVEFLDYIINYINCHNEELGKNEYEFIFSNHFMPYVKKMLKS